jgi:hypothetical protein
MLDLINARDLLIGRCATGRGYRYHLPAFTFYPSDFFPLYEPTIHPLTRVEARQDGYSRPASPPSPSRGRAPLPLQEREVLFGWNQALGVRRPSDAFLLDGGCFGAANRALSDSRSGNSVSADYQAVTNMISDSTSLALQDPRFKAVAVRWVGCMHAAGYGQASLKVDLAGAHKAPTKGQAKRALVDVSCKVRVDFIAVWEALVRTYQQILIHHDTKALHGIASRTSALRARVSATLARG